MGICEESHNIKHKNLNRKSQKYFSDLTHQQSITSNNNSLSEKIQLKVLINQINRKCK